MLLSLKGLSFSDMNLCSLWKISCLYYSIDKAHFTLNSARSLDKPANCELQHRDSEMRSNIVGFSGSKRRDYGGYS